jgi:predicted alpha-1,2-mannosidase
MNGLVDWVNPLQGTDSVLTFSHGNSLPLVGTPSAMTSWSLQTAEDPWFFHPRLRQLQGVRATRQPSPWIGDYGHFVLMPQTGRRMLPAGSRSSGYRIEHSVIRPHYLKVFLGRYETLLELTATPRCGFLKIAFPSDAAEKRLVLDVFKGESSIRIQSSGGRGRVTGFTRANAGGTTRNFAGYFVLDFDCPIVLEESGLFHKDKTFPETSAGTDEQLGAFMALKPRDGAPVCVRVGTSFISVERAERNLDAEIGGKSFEAVADETAGVWNDLLGRAEIEALSDEQRRTFYSCLYRALLFPRAMHEPDAAGKPQHFSPYTGRVESGVFYTDNGFWDTFRTVYPLYAVLYPERYAEILQGYLAHYRESGWLPRWPSPGDRNCMIGTHIDAVIADAVVKGIEGFDVATALEGMLKHARQEAPPNMGRPALREYIEKGYVPEDRTSHGVSSTLDYAYDDFCISQVAAKLGRHDVAAEMRKRALNYRNVFDPSVGFMRGRLASGAWVEPFDEFAWGGPYVEGSVWQCGWAVPHDPAGLIRLMGGDEAFAAKLDRMFTLPPTFHMGGYGGEIHEMTEMAAVDFGQYAHSNQPVHQVLYLYTAAGRPDRTQYWVRRVLAELYHSGPEGFCGDEDNGEMASWYVLGALGFFALCPGHPSYVLGSPALRRAVLHPRGRKELVIEAAGNSPEHLYVAGVELNGQSVRRTFLQHSELAGGGVLKFAMSREPVWNSVPDANDRPFSLLGPATNP